MTKFLLITASLVFGLSTNAQYVLTQPGAPKAGDSNNVIYDTIPQVTKGNAGASQYWDFTDFDLNVDQISTWNDAATAPNGSDFPEAELEVGNSYFDVTANRFDWIGLVINFTDTPQVVRLSNPESFARFPSTYQTTFNDTSAFKASFFIGQDFGGATIDSGRITYNQTKTVLFDAWGTIVTPMGYFSEAIRERTYAIVENKFEACVVVLPGFPCQWVDAGTIDPNFSGGKDTSVTYAWYNQLSSNPVATISYNASEDSVMEATINNDPSFTSVSELSSVNGLVYPNPASDIVFIKTASQIEEVRITDLQGRLVLLNTKPSDRKVNVSELIAGNYILTFITAEGVYTDQLSILK